MIEIIVHFLILQLIFFFWLNAVTIYTKGQVQVLLIILKMKIPKTWSKTMAIIFCKIKIWKFDSNITEPENYNHREIFTKHVLCTDFPNTTFIIFILEQSLNFLNFSQFIRNALWNTMKWLRLEECWNSQRRI